MKFILCLTSIGILLNACQSNRSDSNKNEISDSLIIIKGDSILITYDNGVKKSAKTIKGGYVSGPSDYYYANGNIKQFGNLVDGKKVGTWKFLSWDSKLDSVVLYEDDKPVFILDKTDFEFSEVYFAENKFKIKLPNKWVKVDEPKALLVARKSDCIKPNYCPNIIIEVGNINTNDLHSYVKLYFDLLSKNLEKFSIISERQFLINRFVAYEVGYVFDIKGEQIGNLNTFIINGSSIYNISCSASNRPRGEFLKFKNLFEEITFSFTKVY